MSTTLWEVLEAIIKAIWTEQYVGMFKNKR